MSPDGTIISWNTGAKQVYGYLAGEILGKNIMILEPNDLREETKHLTEKIKLGEKIQRYETSQLKKDGTIINVSVTLSPVFDAFGGSWLFQLLPEILLSESKRRNCWQKLKMPEKKKSI